MGGMLDLLHRDILGGAGERGSGTSSSNASSSSSLYSAIVQRSGIKVFPESPFIADMDNISIDQDISPDSYFDN